MSKKIKKTTIQEIKDEYEVLNKYYEIYKILEENKEFLEIKINEDYQLNENTIQEIERIIEINEKEREKFYENFRDGGVEKQIDDFCNDHTLQQLKDKNNFLKNNINEYLKKMVSEIEEGNLIDKFIYEEIEIKEDNYIEFQKKYKKKMNKIDVFVKLSEKIYDIIDKREDNESAKEYAEKFGWILGLDNVFSLFSEELIKIRENLLEEYLVKMRKEYEILEETSKKSYESLEQRYKGFDEKISNKYRELEEKTEKIIEKYENLEENYKNFNQKTLEIMGIFLMIFSLFGIGTTSILHIQDNIVSKILMITGIIILGMSVLFYFIKNSFKYIAIPFWIGIVAIIVGVTCFSFKL
ncbi:Bax inhibitor-1/YccA family protein [Leptotrichia sp. oral taxon 847]|uniref:Bax inhibitor-1/YccA family protein n=1 Tax=Leptotrichia sp. oral taxon 847 TaxID=1785996 RepID=UPI00076846AF|nr:Bax inhibitor-1/YccA family protein [Leptotrichia sp. oral taxon 847]AMD94880.1 hypothetical protein AXF11_04280 [Leptotrichia sp. oral taxon 847]